MSSFISFTLMTIVALPFALLFWSAVFTFSLALQAGSVRAGRAVRTWGDTKALPWMHRTALNMVQRSYDKRCARAR
ncbi:MAG: hypothetical protein ABGY96_27395 [bacterium]